MLYREFIRLRTKETENRCKRYKNKLTHIIRVSKKDYYQKLLEENKNIKELWTTLNSIIRNNSQQLNYPEYYFL